MLLSIACMEWTLLLADAAYQIQTKIVSSLSSTAPIRSPQVLASKSMLFAVMTPCFVEVRREH